MFQEFKDFVLRGNVVDMAIGIIIGAAFNGVVNSVVNDIVLPPIGLLLGKVDFANLFIVLSKESVSTLAEAQEAGIPTLNYGLFINTVLDFLIVAFVVFMVMRLINRWHKEKKEVAADNAEPEDKDCPFCLTEIPFKATRCAFCTSQLEVA